jgi:hypothetical protein
LVDEVVGVEDRKRPCVELLEKRLEGRRCCVSGIDPPFERDDEHRALGRFDVATGVSHSSRLMAPD